MTRTNTGKTAHVSGQIENIMPETVIYTAIFETEKYILYLSYEPGPDGAIFIVAAEIVEKPVTPWQARERTRRK